MLDLTEAELNTFTSQLGAILDHATDMEALDLADVVPTHHPFRLANVMRADAIDPTPLRDDMLAAAPAVQDDRFRVPPALGEEP